MAETAKLIELLQQQLEAQRKQTEVRCIHQRGSEAGVIVSTDASSHSSDDSQLRSLRRHGRALDGLLGKIPYFPWS